ncbi:ferritin-like domain-containing protein [Shouchella miscanthi]|uniref:Ferritin-like domain-containing protein n=1 Tax=Shouchella miscanthi TaxID=2598861 RepID=A0ABU6NIW8_9BACI|nr:ferritin-like domain-containing protein [Shouchella miscanthi]
MHMDAHEVKTLNQLLEGQYMGIHSYEHFLEHLSAGSPLYDTMTAIHHDLEKHASLLATRIEALDGVPVKSEGAIGTIQRWLSELFDRPHGEEDILKHAIKGENLYGIRMSEKIARQGLDEEILQLVHRIIDEQREHVDQLKKKLHH